MRIFKIIAVGMICVAVGRLSAELESKVSSLKSAGSAVVQAGETKMAVLMGEGRLAAQQGSAAKTATGVAGAGFIDRNIDAENYYSEAN